MYSKRELIEIMLRPQPMPDTIRENIIAELLQYAIDEFIHLFRRETNLDIRPCGHNLFTVKY
jgi:hypothetical protein